MTNTEARFNKIHIRKVYACLAVTCHLHFWQNDRDFLRATVVARGWNGYRNKSQHRKSTLEKKILPPFQQGFEPRPFNHESGALTTELSPPPPPPPPVSAVTYWGGFMAANINTLKTLTSEVWGFSFTQDGGVCSGLKSLYC